ARATASSTRTATTSWPSVAVTPCPRGDRAQNSPGPRRSGPGALQKPPVAARHGPADPITLNTKNAMSHSRNSPARVLATQRRQQAVALRSEGHTYKQIGQELGVSLPRAHQLVDEAMTTTRAQTAANVEELRGRELMKLDALEDAIWAKAA